MPYLTMYEKQGVVNGKYLMKYLVGSESDLANLPDDTSPGSIAHTEGFVDQWEYGMDGTWTRIVQSSGASDLQYIFGSDSGLPYIQEV